MKLRNLNDNTKAIILPSGFEVIFKVTDKTSISELYMWPSYIQIYVKYIEDLNIYKINAPSWSAKHIFGRRIH